MKTLKTSYEKISIETFNFFKGIKVIVFDFDNTLYQNVSWNGYNEFFINSVRKFFLKLSDDEFSYYLHKYHVVNSDRVSENTAKMLLDLKGSTSELVEFLKTVKFDSDWENSKTFPKKILADLCKRYKLYIVSNSAKENIEFVAKNVKLNLKYFTNILPNVFKETDLTKMSRLKEIAKIENVNFSEMLMVGDSIKYDLIPAKKLGFKTLLIQN